MDFINSTLKIVWIYIPFVILLVNKYPLHKREELVWKDIFFLLFLQWIFLYAVAAAFARQYRIIRWFSNSTSCNKPGERTWMWSCGGSSAFPLRVVTVPGMYWKVEHQLEAWLKNEWVIACFWRVFHVILLS